MYVCMYVCMPTLWYHPMRLGKDSYTLLSFLARLGNSGSDDHFLFTVNIDTRDPTDENDHFLTFYIECAIAWPLFVPLSTCYQFESKRQVALVVGAGDAGLTLCIILCISHHILIV